MPIFNNILAGASGQSTGYDIERSVVFDTNSYFTRTPSSSSNRKTWTWSGWIKRGAPDQRGFLFWSGTDISNNNDGIEFDGIVLRAFSYASGSAVFNIVSSAYYRDPSAWYHIMVCFDSTESSAANRAKLYVNGEKLTDISETQASLNADCGFINTTTEHRIGNANGSHQWDGYLAEVHFIDGQALTPASFGETNSNTNQWIAKKYEGSYGTNGFYLDFATRATDPIDASGNGNNWGSVNVIAGDWKIDSPTNNFATLNPLDPAANQTLSEGNLKQVTSGQGISKGTMQIPSSGKWYWEVCQTDTDQLVIGIAKPTATLSNYLGSDANGWGYGGYDGSLYNNGSGSSYGNTYTNGDIVGVAFDADNQAVYFSKNNTWQNSGDPTSGSSKTGAAVSSLTDEYSPASGSQNSSGVYNFGQDSSFAGNKTAQGNGGVGEDFYYTPPTGFKALNTGNLDDPSIADPTKHFNTKLWTSTSADGTSALGAVTGVGFQPDLVWAKGRSAGWDHNLFNSVMGTGLGKALYTNGTFIEGAYDTSGYGNVTSFDSDGFTVGLTAGNNYAYNYGSGTKYLAWNWKAGGTASSNGDGSITSSVSANPTAGFSIVSYTGNSTAGATVGHGLSQAPDLVITKERTNADSWLVFHKSLGNTKAAFLDVNVVPGTHTTYWNNTSPSSTVVTLGSDNKGNGSGTMIMYCFHSVDGYSKVDSYTGNGSTDGTFVYTGFRPAFLLIKRTDATGVWPMFDNKRVGYNWDNRQLRANEATAEETSNTFIDILSNGFKCKNTAADKNASGGTYIYLAFAESPFKYSNAR